MGFCRWEGLLMITRREVMRSIAGASVIMPVAAEAHPSPTIDGYEQEAHRLAELMRDACGRQWRVSVDQNLEFILVQKVLA